MKVMENLQDYALLVEKKKKGGVVSTPVVVDEHKSNSNQVVAVWPPLQTDSSVALLRFRTLSRRIIKFTWYLPILLLPASSRESSQSSDYFPGSETLYVSVLHGQLALKNKCVGKTWGLPLAQCKSSSTIHSFQLKAESRQEIAHRQLYQLTTNTEAKMTSKLVWWLNHGTCWA